MPTFRRKEAAAVKAHGKRRHDALLKDAQELKVKIHRFISNCKARGISIANVFRTFDRNEDGSVTFDELANGLDVGF